MVRVTIDGVERTLPRGLTILGALRDLGVEIPHLCHDDRLRPAAVCRLCLVEVAGEARPVPACATPLSDGMDIRTHTPALEQGRRATLALLARNHPAGRDDTPFLRLVRAYGVEEELDTAPRRALRDRSHPYLRADMSRCITCLRCVRICDEVQGLSVWSVLGRGARARVAPALGATLVQSECVACGACVDACPTGALEDETVLRMGAPQRWTRTTCPYCGVGCEVQVGTRDDRIVTVRPALDAPVNKGHLCSKGRYAFGFLHAHDRIVAPHVRDGGRWRQASWDEAIGIVAQRLRRVLDRHGPESVGVLGSARGTNEECYLAQKLARVVLGTHNVDCCARVCHAPSAVALRTMLGTGAATSSYEDVERARTILVFGANVTESHPVLGARIRQAGRRGADLLVVDPRRTELARAAKVHLQLRPGTNVPLLNAMAQVILTEGLADEAFLGERASGREAFETFVAAWTPERAAALCGVAPSLIREAARRYARGRPALSVHGLGLTEHVQGTEAVMCLVNLALLTGNVGKPGTGVNPLRGQNNVQGAAHMGCEPRNLTGFVAIEEGRARFEAAWGAPLPHAAGLDLPEMLDAARAGRFHALWAIGYDVLLTHSDARATREALASLDLLVVQDLFMNETARELATVFLPAAASFEKDGTFMNAERRVQRVRRAVAPPLGVRTDWEIVCAVAREMGHPGGFEFGSAEQIWDEIRALWPAGAGIGYARLERGGIQWPCPSESHPGTALLHVQGFAGKERAALQQIDFVPSPEVTTKEFPFTLSTGRTLQQFNAGTMTRRTPHLSLHPLDVLSISPPDARRLGVRDGEAVRVRSRHGEAVLPARMDDAVRPGELFATFHGAEAFINRVTGPSRDRHTATPEYKRTAVAVAPVRTGPNVAVRRRPRRTM